MHDPLSLLWPHMDAPAPVFSERSFTPWSNTAFNELKRAGFLKNAPNSDWIPCPDCGTRHFEEVKPRPRPGGIVDYYVLCPETGRVRVPPRLLEQWEIDFTALAQAISFALCVTGQCINLLPGRLWRLGRTRWRNLARDVLFARGLNWDDGLQIAKQIAHTTRPIVTVPDRAPSIRLWPGRVPPVVALSQVAWLTEERIDVAQDAVVSQIVEADTTTESTTIHVPELKLMIRQQVVANEKTELTDAVFVAAYQQEGSLRKAAAFLSQTTGEVVSKDRVQYALERSGGMKTAARRFNKRPA